MTTASPLPAESHQLIWDEDQEPGEALASLFSKFEAWKANRPYLES